MIYDLRRRLAVVRCRLLGRHNETELSRGLYLQVYACLDCGDRRIEEKYLGVTYDIYESDSSGDDIISRWMCD
jgi:hypothetical protein